MRIHSSEDRTAGPNTRIISFWFFRVFRRRRRPRSSLARLFSDVTESCQSWLDEKVFRGVFGTGQNQNQNWDEDQDQDKEVDWTRTNKEGPAPLDLSTWSGFTSTELDGSHSFTYGLQHLVLLIVTFCRKHVVCSVLQRC